MGKFRDLTNMRFGRLVVTSLADDYVSPSGYHKKRWACHCDCGNDVVVWAANLICGHTQSCGCLHEEKIASGNVKHGLCYSRIYNIWRGMIARCENPNSEYYYAYGGRGIRVCAEWRNNPTAFYQWSIWHGYDDSLSIDRIDNDGNYCPDNCRWATRTEQANNTSRNHMIEYNGKNKTLTKLAKEFGIDPKALSWRLELGWDIEDALDTPVKSGNRYKTIQNTTKGENTQ